MNPRHQDQQATGTSCQAVHHKQPCAIAQDEFGIQLPFPYKLHKMLELAEERKYDDIISWLPNGLAFRVHKRDELIKATIPGFFKQTKYKSFLRQLNMWGFVRIVGGAYYHENFRRDNPELCHLLSRVPKSKASRMPPSAYKFNGGPSSTPTAAASLMINNKMMLPQPNESTKRGLTLLNDLVDSSSACHRASGGNPSVPNATTSGGGDGNNPFLLPRLTSGSPVASRSSSSSNVNALSIKTIIEDDLFGSSKYGHYTKNCSSNRCTHDSHLTKSVEWANAVATNPSKPASPVTSVGNPQGQVQQSFLSHVFDMMDKDNVNDNISSSKVEAPSCKPVRVESLNPGPCQVRINNNRDNNSYDFSQFMGGSMQVPTNGNGSMTTIMMEPRSIEAMTEGRRTKSEIISRNSSSLPTSSSSDELFQDDDLATVLGEFRGVDEGRNPAVFVAL